MQPEGPKRMRRTASLRLSCCARNGGTTGEESRGARRCGKLSQRKRLAGRSRISERPDCCGGIRQEEQAEVVSKVGMQRPAHLAPGPHKSHRFACTDSSHASVAVRDLANAYNWKASTCFNTDAVRVGSLRPSQVQPAPGTCLCSSRHGHPDTLVEATVPYASRACCMVGHEPLQSSEWDRQISGPTATSHAATVVPTGQLMLQERMNNVPRRKHTAFHNCGVPQGNRSWARLNHAITSGSAEEAGRRKNH